jgi:hypothetical protein
MLKYRKLTDHELSKFEKQFNRFLAKNSVDEDRWAEIQRKEPSKARYLIELFSDYVFDNILGNSPCLEKITPKEFRTYYFSDDSVELIVVKLTQDAPEAFTNENITTVLGDALIHDHLKIYRAEKEFDKSREQEMYAVLESGTFPASKDNYELLHDWIS